MVLKYQNKSTLSDVVVGIDLPVKKSTRTKILNLILAEFFTNWETEIESEVLNQA